MNIYLYFMIYSMLGWCLESIFISIGNKRLINSGFFYGPYCPIYGFGSLIVLYILNDFYEYPLLLFIFSILLTSILEYFTSYLLEKIFHVLWWDYSKHKFNINGRVCLLNSLLFGLMSLIVTYVIHPFIISFIERNPFELKIIMTSLLLIIFIFDLFFSVKHLIKFKQATFMFDQNIENMKLESNSTYAFYKNKFPNIKIRGTIVPRKYS